MMDRRKLSAFRPEYHSRERQWYLWNGKEAIEEDGALRLFMSASDAYDWIAKEAGHLPAQEKD